MTPNDCFSNFWPLPSVRNWILLNFLCFFLLISPFIGVDQFGFHTTLALSAIAALSEYGSILAQCVSHAKRAFTFQNYPYFLALSVHCPLSLCITLSAWDTLSEQIQIFNLLLGLYFVFLHQLFTKHPKFIKF